MSLNKFVDFNINLLSLDNILQSPQHGLETLSPTKRTFLERNISLGITSRFKAHGTLNPYSTRGTTMFGGSSNLSSSLEDMASPRRRVS